MANYKIGDKVIIREDVSNLQHLGWYSRNKGETVTITSVTGRNSYSVLENNLSWNGDWLRPTKIEHFDEGLFDL